MPEPVPVFRGQLAANCGKPTTPNRRKQACEPNWYDLTGFVTIWFNLVFGKFSSGVIKKIQNHSLGPGSRQFCERPAISACVMYGLLADKPPQSSSW